MGDKHRKRLDELLADTSGTMTDWEIDWITHLDRWVADLNADQAEMLKLVWAKVFGVPNDRSRSSG